MNAPTSTTRLASYLNAGLTYSVTESMNGDGAWVKFQIAFPEGEQEAANEWAAQFPKSNKVHVTTLSGRDQNFYAGDGTFAGSKLVNVDKVTGEELVKGAEDYYTASSWSVPFITVDFRFISNGVTGAKNEAAGKRLRSFLKNLDKAGISYTKKEERLANRQPSLEEILARFA